VRRFVDSFLRIILAKSALTGGVGFGDRLGREGLANRNQGDVPGRAPGGCGCHGNTCFNSLQAGGYFVIIVLQISM